jgi:hypothetical protein
VDKSTFAFSLNESKENAPFALGLSNSEKLSSTSRFGLIRRLNLSSYRCGELLRLRLRLDRCLCFEDVVFFSASDSY